MFGFFNKKSKKTSPHDIGARGSNAAIRAAAQEDCDWDEKKELLQGCLAAFDAGNHTNLRVFIMAYLEFKRTSGAIDKLENNTIDRGFTELITTPLLYLLERQQNPGELLDELSSDMSVYYRQIMLDLLLRQACVNNSWMMVPILLTAGADVNTGRSRPLASAATKSHIKIITLLLDANADIAQARAHVSSDKEKAFDLAIHAAQSSKSPFSATGSTVIEAPRLDITPAGRTVIKKPGDHKP